MRAYRAEVVYVVDDATDEALASTAAARDELTSWLENLGAAAVTVTVAECAADDEGGRS